MTSTQFQERKSIDNPKVNKLIEDVAAIVDYKFDNKVFV